MEWFEVSRDDCPVPGWMRRAARDSNGTIYLPPPVAGVSEMEMLLCAGYDGVSAILDGEHAYYPADWIARVFPVAEPTVSRVKERLNETSSKG